MYCKTYELSNAGEIMSFFCRLQYSVFVLSLISIY